MLTGRAPASDYPGDWLPPGLDAVGDRLATVVRGLCRLDPHLRMRLPEASVRLDELVSHHGPGVVAGPVPPVPSGLRTSDPAMATGGGLPPSAPASAPVAAGSWGVSGPAPASVAEPAQRPASARVGYPPLPPDELVRTVDPLPPGPQPPGPPAPPTNAPAAGPAYPNGYGPAAAAPPAAAPPAAAVPGGPAVAPGALAHPTAYPSGAWGPAAPAAARPGTPANAGSMGTPANAGSLATPASVAPPPGVFGGPPVTSDPAASPRVVGAGSEPPSGVQRVNGRRVISSGGRKAAEQRAAGPQGAAGSQPRTVSSGTDPRRASAGPAGSGRVGHDAAVSGAAVSGAAVSGAVGSASRPADQPGYTVPYRPERPSDQPGYTVPYQPGGPPSRSQPVPPPAAPRRRRRGVAVVVVVVLVILACAAVAVVQIAG